MSSAAGAVDEAVREYLLFRGFAKTLQTFEAERRNDPEKGLKADAIVAQFMAYVESHDLAPLLGLWRHLDTRFFSRLEYSQVAAAEKLEDSLKKLYLTHAVLQNQTEKVTEFFQLQAKELRGREDWQEWFALPYIKNPTQQPPFSKFFRRAWVDTFTLSLHNFLASIFHHLPLPVLLNFSSEQNDSVQLTALRAEISRLQVQVRELQQQHSDNSKSKVDAEAAEVEKRKSMEVPPAALTQQSVEATSTTTMRKRAATARGALVRAGTPPAGEREASPTVTTATKPRKGKERPRRATYVVLSQEVYAGHRTGSSVVTCQFARDGDNVLSADDQGCVLIWNAPTMGPILSLDIGSTFASACWQTEKSLLVAHVDGRFQTYSIHSDRPVIDFVLDSPGRPLLAVARPGKAQAICAVHDASSDQSYLALIDLEKRCLSSRIDASVVPHPIHDMCFNGNGSLMAIGCSDGRLRVLDVDGNTVIREFEAGPGPVTACRFSKDDSKVYTCGPESPLRIWTSSDLGTALTVGGAATHLALMQDGNFCVAAGGSDAAVKIYSTTPTEGAEPLEAVLTIIEQHSAAVTAVDSRGSTVLTGDAAGGVQVTLLLRL